MVEHSTGFSQFGTKKLVSHMTQMAHLAVAVVVDLRSVQLPKYLYRFNQSQTILLTN
jgi:hypothetical protein